MDYLRSNRWEPLLKGSLKTQAVKAIGAIARALQNPPAAFIPGYQTDKEALAAQEASLSGGRAGYALLFDSLARSDGNHRYKKHAAMFLADAIEAVAAVPMGASLYGGFTGIGWATAQLRRGADNGLVEVDKALCNHVKLSPWKGDFDLISGLVGFGVYALERLRNRAANVWAHRCLTRIVNRLEEIAVETTDGLAWFTPADLLPPSQREETPEGYFNLGLAHGVPGVIAMLGHTYKAGIQRRRTLRLLDSSVKWLLNQKLPTNAGSCFSSRVAPGIDRRPSRSAWCYGDPGVAIALLSAARSLGEKSWEEEALKIARHTAERPPDQSGILDAGLCHGSAGLAHIFNRIYQATGEILFQKTAQFWYERTLQFRQPGKGVGGFQSCLPKREGTAHWFDEPGLLTGATGIALALHTAVTSTEPKWDGFLLTKIEQ